VWARTGAEEAPLSQAKIVPDVSLILEYSYVYRNDDTEQETVPAEFNLDNMELALSASLDPFFNLSTVFQVGEGGIDIEEICIEVHRLPMGFQIKFGQFLSSFGHFNSQHDHLWIFSDQPNIYSAFFGDSNLNEKGVQVNWNAPLDVLLQVGLEILTSQNEVSFSGSPSDLDLLVYFLKSEFDVGSVSVVGGLSYAVGTHEPLVETGGKRFDMPAECHLYGADLALKYVIDSQRYISMQSEYLLRERGEGSCSGGYTDLIWRLARRWRMGLRYDWIEYYHAYRRVSAMLEFCPSRFSWIRLQYTRDWSAEPDLVGLGIDQLRVQFTIELSSNSR
jgi:hypothetical protein